MQTYAQVYSPNLTLYQDRLRHRTRENRRILKFILELFTTGDSTRTRLVNKFHNVASAYLSLDNVECSNAMPHLEGIPRDSGQKKRIDRRQRSR